MLAISIIQQRQVTPVYVHQNMWDEDTVVVVHSTIQTQSSSMIKDLLLIAIVSVIKQSSYFVNLFTHKQ